MNVIFISLHFPRHFYQFCTRLKERGVTVLGIGDCPWEGIGERCQNALSDYRFVPSLKDYDAVYRVVAEYIFRYGRIDYVESENEYWLELDARIRTDFNITTGPKLEAMADMNHKSRMKAAYQRAGIPAARWTLPSSLAAAKRFANKVGYPIIVKPDQGVGASSTYKLRSEGGWPHSGRAEIPPSPSLRRSVSPAMWRPSTALQTADEACCLLQASACR